MASYFPKGNTTINIMIALSIVCTIVTIAYGCSTVELGEKKTNGEIKRTKEVEKGNGKF